MRFALLFAGLLLLSAPSRTSADVLSIYTGGTLSFDYDQFPFGSLTGSFRASGDIADISTFPLSETGACMGVVLDTDTTDYFTLISGFRNPDDSVDLAFVHIRRDVGIGGGQYSFDPVNQRVEVGFIDDATLVVMPEDLATFDLRDWISTIEARNRFTGALGSVTLTTVSPERIDGTFDGLLMDTEAGTLVSLSHASFSLASDPLPVEDTSWGRIKARYQP